MQKKKILENIQILNKIKRISLQIIESNLDSNKIIICGIEKNGALLAEKISKELDLISDKNIIFCSMKINKSNPTEDIQLSIDINECKNQSVVIVDDVLNSGKTLTYALKHFLVIFTSLKDEFKWGFSWPWLTSVKNRMPEVFLFSFIK